MERRRPRRTQEWDVEVDVTPKTDRPVGSSGTFMLGDLPVHRMGFGAMRITGPGIWGPPEDHDEAIAVLRRAVELGVDFIDTADSYGPYVSEELICEALYPYPEGLVIGTKAGLTRIGPDPADWPPVGRPEYLRQECLMSLRRLRLDCIDLFQLHRIDVKVPAAEQFGVLKELRDEGKVRHVGSVRGHRGARSKRPARSSPSCRCRTSTTWPTAGPKRSSSTARARASASSPGSPSPTARCRRGAGRWPRWPRRWARAPAQVALAWLLRRSPVMVPIPGTSKVVASRGELRGVDGGALRRPVRRPEPAAAHEARSRAPASS